MNRISPAYKIIAVLTALCLECTSILIPTARAELISPIVPSIKKLNPELLKLPEKFGEVVESHSGKGNVIIIQDAHAIPDAQKNIANVIKFMQKEYGVSSVALEGASGDLDPQIFRSFPDKKLLRQVMKGYMDAGEIAGGTAAAVFDGTPTKYVGVEDWDVYEEGLGLYLSAIEKEPELLQKLNAERLTLNAEKEKVYSKELLAVDQAVEKFYENAAQLTDLIKVLGAIQAPKVGSELEALWKEVNKSQQPTANSTQTKDIEVRQLASQVEKALKTPGAVKAFNMRKQEWMTGSISPEAFALHLKEWADQSGLNLEMSSDLHGMVRDQQTLKSLEGTKLFRDLEVYIREVKDMMFTHTTSEVSTSDVEEGRGLDQRTNSLRIVTKLAKLELSREEWKEFKSNSLQPTKARSDKKALGSRLSAMGLSQGDMVFHLAFYLNAEERDQIFFDNISTANTSDVNSRHIGGGKGTTVIVAGGFHAEGLTSRLKAAGMGYALVMPKINHIPESLNYRAQMRGEVSWKDYFEVENGRIHLYKAFVRAMRDQLLRADSTTYNVNRTKSDEVRSTNYALLKSWRDQIIRDLSDQGKVQRAVWYTRYMDEVIDQRSADSVKRSDDLLMKVDNFIRGLRGLEKANQLTSDQIAALLKANMAQTVVGGPSQLSQGFPVLAELVVRAKLEMGKWLDIAKKYFSKKSEFDLEGRRRAFDAEPEDIPAPNPSSVESSEADNTTVYGGEKVLERLVAQHSAEVPKAPSIADYIFLDKGFPDDIRTAFRANHVGEDGLYYIKVNSPHPKKGSDSNQRGVVRVAREAALLHHIHTKHPDLSENVPELVGIGKTNSFGYVGLERVYIVTKAVVGLSLADRIYAINKSNKSEKEKHIEIYQILKSLTELIEKFHAHGIYNRDLSPLDILIDENNRITILDFDAATIENTAFGLIGLQNLGLANRGNLYSGINPSENGARDVRSLISFMIYFADILRRRDKFREGEFAFREGEFAELKNSVAAQDALRIFATGLKIELDQDGNPLRSEMRTKVQKIIAVALAEAITGEIPGDFHATAVLDGKAISLREIEEASLEMGSDPQLIEKYFGEENGLGLSPEELDSLYEGLTEAGYDLKNEDQTALISKLKEIFSRKYQMVLLGFQLSRALGEAKREPVILGHQELVQTLKQIVLHVPSSISDDQEYEIGETLESARVEAMFGTAFEKHRPILKGLELDRASVLRDPQVFLTGQFAGPIIAGQPVAAEAQSQFAKEKFIDQVTLTIATNLLMGEAVGAIAGGGKTLEAWRERQKEVQQRVKVQLVDLLLDLLSDFNVFWEKEKQGILEAAANRAANQKKFNELTAEAKELRAQFRVAHFHVQFEGSHDEKAVPLMLEAAEAFLLKTAESIEFFYANNSGQADSQGLIILEAALDAVVSDFENLQYVYGLIHGSAAQLATLEMAELMEDLNRRFEKLTAKIPHSIPGQYTYGLLESWKQYAALRLHPGQSNTVIITNKADREYYADRAGNLARDTEKISRFFEKNRGVKIKYSPKKNAIIVTALNGKGKSITLPRTLDYFVFRDQLFSAIDQVSKVSRSEARNLEGIYAEFSNENSQSVNSLRVDQFLFDAVAEQISEKSILEFLEGKGDGDSFSKLALKKLQAVLAIKKMIFSEVEDDSQQAFFKLYETLMGDVINSDKLLNASFVGERTDLEILSSMAAAASLLRAIRIVSTDETGAPDLSRVRILDIGFGTGKLLYFLKFFGINAKGIGVNKNSVNHAQGQKLDVSWGDILNPDSFNEVLKEKTFNIVVMNNVIEALKEKKGNWIGFKRGKEAVLNAVKLLPRGGMFVLDQNSLQYLDGTDPGSISSLTSGENHFTQISLYSSMDVFGGMHVGFQSRSEARGQGRSELRNKLEQLYLEQESATGVSARESLFKNNIGDLEKSLRKSRDPKARSAAKNITAFRVLKIGDEAAPTYGLLLGDDKGKVTLITLKGEKLEATDREKTKSREAISLFLVDSISTDNSIHILAQNLSYPPRLDNLSKIKLNNEKFSFDRPAHLKIISAIAFTVALAKLSWLAIQKLVGSSLAYLIARVVPPEFLVDSDSLDKNLLFVIAYFLLAVVLIFAGSRLDNPERAIFKLFGRLLIAAPPVLLLAAMAGLGMEGLAAILSITTLSVLTIFNRISKRFAVRASTPSQASEQAREGGGTVGGGRSQGTRSEARKNQDLQKLLYEANHETTLSIISPRDKPLTENSIVYVIGTEHVGLDRLLAYLTENTSAQFHLIDPGITETAKGYRTLNNIPGTSIPKGRVKYFSQTFEDYRKDHPDEMASVIMANAVFTSPQIDGTFKEIALRYPEAKIGKRATTKAEDLRDAMLGSLLPDAKIIIGGFVKDAVDLDEILKKFFPEMTETHPQQFENGTHVWRVLPVQDINLPMLRSESRDDDPSKVNRNHLGGAEGGRSEMRTEYKVYATAFAALAVFAFLWSIPAVVALFGLVANSWLALLTGILASSGIWVALSMGKAKQAEDVKLIEFAGLVKSLAMNSPPDKAVLVEIKRYFEQLSKLELVDLKKFYYRSFWERLISQILLTTSSIEANAFAGRIQQLKAAIPSAGWTGSYTEAEPTIDIEFVKDLNALIEIDPKTQKLLHPYLIWHMYDSLTQRVSLDGKGPVLGFDEERKGGGKRLKLNLKRSEVRQVPAKSIPVWFAGGTNEAVGDKIMVGLTETGLVAPLFTEFEDMGKVGEEKNSWPELAVFWKTEDATSFLEAKLGEPGWKLTPVLLLEKEGLLTSPEESEKLKELQDVWPGKITVIKAGEISQDLLRKTLQLPDEETQEKLPDLEEFQKYWETAGVSDTVLIVDDSYDFQEQLATVATESGYPQVLQAGSVFKAFAVLEQLRKEGKGRPTIILDFDMPEGKGTLNGDWLLRYLLLVPAWKDQILLVSAEPANWQRLNIEDVTSFDKVKDRETLKLHLLAIRKVLSERHHKLAEKVVPLSEMEEAVKKQAASDSFPVSFKPLTSKNISEYWPQIEEIANSIESEGARWKENDFKLRVRWGEEDGYPLSHVGLDPTSGKVVSVALISKSASSADPSDVTFRRAYHVVHPDWRRMGIRMESWRYTVDRIQEISEKEKISGETKTYWIGFNVDPKNESMLRFAEKLLGRKVTEADISSVWYEKGSYSFKISLDDALARLNPSTDLRSEVSDYTSQDFTANVTFIEVDDGGANHQYLNPAFAPNGDLFARRIWNGEDPFKAGHRSDIVRLRSAGGGKGVKFRAGEVVVENAEDPRVMQLTVDGKKRWYLTYVKASVLENGDSEWHSELLEIYGRETPFKNSVLNLLMRVVDAFVNFIARIWRSQPISLSIPLGFDKNAYLTQLEDGRIVFIDRAETSINGKKAVQFYEFDNLKHLEDVMHNPKSEYWNEHSVQKTSKIFAPEGYDHVGFNTMLDLNDSEFMFGVIHLAKTTKGGDAEVQGKEYQTALVLLDRKTLEPVGEPVVIHSQKNVSAPIVYATAVRQEGDKIVFYAGINDKQLARIEHSVADVRKMMGRSETRRSPKGGRQKKKEAAYKSELLREMQPIIKFMKRKNIEVQAGVDDLETYVDQVIGVRRKDGDSITVTPGALELYIKKHPDEPVPDEIQNARFKVEMMVSAKREGISLKRNSKIVLFIGGTHIIGGYYYKRFEAIVRKTFGKALNLVYLPFPIEDKKADASDVVDQRMQLIRHQLSGNTALRGAIATRPWKAEFLGLAKKADQIAGAVNFLIKGPDEKLDVTAYDGIAWINGLNASLGKNFDFRGKKMVILGAGAVAREIIVALVGQGVDRITLAENNPKVIKATKKMIKDLGLKASVKIERGDDVSLRQKSVNLHEAIREADLVVNATGIGYGATKGQSPLIDYGSFIRGKGEKPLIASELISNDDTEFMEKAAEVGGEGVTVVSGRKMTAEGFSGFIWMIIQKTFPRYSTQANVEKLAKETATAFRSRSEARKEERLNLLDPKITHAEIVAKLRPLQSNSALKNSQLRNAAATEIIQLIKGFKQEFWKPRYWAGLSLKDVAATIGLESEKELEAHFELPEIRKIVSRRLVLLFFMTLAFVFFGKWVGLVFLSGLFASKAKSPGFGVFSKHRSAQDAQDVAKAIDTQIYKLIEVNPGVRGIDFHVDFAISLESVLEAARIDNFPVQSLNDFALYGINPETYYNQVLDGTIKWITKTKDEEAVLASFESNSIINFMSPFYRKLFSIRRSLFSRKQPITFNLVLERIPYSAWRDWAVPTPMPDSSKLVTPDGKRLTDEFYKNYHERMRQYWRGIHERNKIFKTRLDTSRKEGKVSAFFLGEDHRVDEDGLLPGGQVESAQSTEDGLSLSVKIGKLLLDPSGKQVPKIDVLRHMVSEKVRDELTSLGLTAHPEIFEEFIQNVQRLTGPELLEEVTAKGIVGNQKTRESSANLSKMIERLVRPILEDNDGKVPETKWEELIKDITGEVQKENEFLFAYVVDALKREWITGDNAAVVHKAIGEMKKARLDQVLDAFKKQTPKSSAGPVGTDPLKKAGEYVISIPDMYEINKEERGTYVRIPVNGPLFAQKTIRSEMRDPKGGISFLETLDLLSRPWEMNEVETELVLSKISKITRYTELAPLLMVIAGWVIIGLTGASVVGFSALVWITTGFLFFGAMLWAVLSIQRVLHEARTKTPFLWTGFPYNFTQNPIYFSYLMAALFLSTATTWPFALVLLTGVVTFVLPRIAAERAFLWQDFGIGKKWTEDKRFSHNKDNLNLVENYRARVEELLKRPTLFPIPLFVQNWLARQSFSTMRGKTPGELVKSKQNQTPEKKPIAQAVASEALRVLEFEGDYGSSVWYTHEHMRFDFPGVEDKKSVLIRYSEQFRVLRNYLIHELQSGSKQLKFVSLGAGNGREPISIAAYLKWLMDESPVSLSEKSEADKLLGGLLRSKLLNKSLEIKIIAIEQDLFQRTSMKRSLEAGAKYKDSQDVFESSMAQKMVNRYLPSVQKSKWIEVRNGDILDYFDAPESEEKAILFSNEVLKHQGSTRLVRAFWSGLNERVPTGSLLLTTIDDFERLAMLREFWGIKNPLDQPTGEAGRIVFTGISPEYPKQAIPGHLNTYAVLRVPSEKVIHGNVTGRERFHFHFGGRSESRINPNHSESEKQRGPAGAIEKANPWKWIAPVVSIISLAATMFTMWQKSEGNGDNEILRLPPGIKGSGSDSNQGPAFDDKEIFSGVLDALDHQGPSSGSAPTITEAGKGAKIEGPGELIEAARRVEWVNYAIAAQLKALELTEVASLETPAGIPEETQFSGKIFLFKSSDTDYIIFSATVETDNAKKHGSYFLELPKGSSPEQIGEQISLRSKSKGKSFVIPSLDGKGELEVRFSIDGNNTPRFESDAANQEQQEQGQRAILDAIKENEKKPPRRNGEALLADAKTPRSEVREKLKPEVLAELTEAAAKDVVEAISEGKDSVKRIEAANRAGEKIALILGPYNENNDRDDNKNYDRDVALKGLQEAITQKVYDASGEINEDGQDVLNLVFANATMDDMKERLGLSGEANLMGYFGFHLQDDQSNYFTKENVESVFERILPIAQAMGLTPAVTKGMAYQWLVRIIKKKNLQVPGDLESLLRTDDGKIFVGGDVDSYNLTNNAFPIPINFSEVTNADPILIEKILEFQMLVVLFAASITSESNAAPLTPEALKAEILKRLAVTGITEEVLAIDKNGKLQIIGSEFQKIITAIQAQQATAASA